MPAEAKSPVTRAEAARAIVELARERGIPGPPFENSTWLGLAKDVGWIVEPQAEPGVPWSKETRAAEAELEALNERIRQLHDKLAEVERRAVGRDELTFSAGIFGNRRIPGDAAAAAEAEALREELIEAEGKHAAVARALSRFRARDERKHRLKQSGLAGRVKAALS